MAKDTRDRKEEKRAYRAANREAVSVARRAYYLAHRDEILTRKKAQRAVKPLNKHQRAAHTEAERKRRAAHPLPNRESSQRYYQRNRASILAAGRAARAAARAVQ